MVWMAKCMVKVVWVGMVGMGGCRKSWKKKNGETCGGQTTVHGFGDWLLSNAQICRYASPVLGPQIKRPCWKHPDFVIAPFLVQVQPSSYTGRATQIWTQKGLRQKKDLRQAREAAIKTHGLLRLSSAAYNLLTVSEARRTHGLTS